VIHRSDEICGMEDIPTRLKRLRKEKKLTQAALGTAAGITQGAIGNMEKGWRGYGKSLVDIARALGVSPEYLRCEPGAEAKAAAAPIPISAGRVDRPLPGIDFEKVARLSRDEQMQLQGAWIDAAGRLGLDVAAPRGGNRKSA
jgi:transcriptional regulator with XRE-family HTH domain